jgi:heme exporter protein B
VKEFLRPVFLVTWKDILLELRSREVVIASMVFAVMVVVIFNFALNVTPETVDILAPGILWVAFAFAGVLAMSRAFVIEKDQGSLEGLLLCPVSRDSLYFGKMLALFLFMTVVEAVLLPIFAVLFDFSAFSFTLIGVILLATLGFATVGTLFSSIAVNTRSREIMLPVLFFPVITPVIIGAVETSTGAIGSSVNVIGVGRWLQLIAVFDAVFLVLCPWAFGLVMEE